MKTTSKATMKQSINALIWEGEEAFRKAGVIEARREAASLLAHAIGRDRSFLLAHANDLVTAAQCEGFRTLIARRVRREPLQYIVGHQEFFKLDYEVTSDVLIPRPETELLVETALELLKNQSEARFADIGTGSGCIAISVLHELVEARAVATDVSPAALRVALRNAERHSVSSRLMLIESDGFAALDREDEFFLIASNPPYVTEADWQNLQPEIRDFEPRAALVAGADGLANIRPLLDEAPSFLQSRGYFLFEIGFGQSQQVEQLIDRRIWRLIEMRRDLQNIPRTVILQKN